jgi:glycyl-tRNA synthetase beta chain
MDVVRDGNERVLRARLADAAFFWAEDQKKPLQARVEELKNIVYQEQVGTVYEKMERARGLAGWLCSHLGLSEEAKLADRAAFLSKSDLVTLMVYEFPELQGVMGREYAKKNGEDGRVALAIYEQYLPRFAGDKLPSDVVGAVVGMADRIDTMVACTKAGLEPTGSQDPYGFRRAARTINEILWGLSLDVDLDGAVRRAAGQVGADDAVVEKVLAFLRNRLQIQLKEKGFSHESVSLALSAIWNRPYQAMALVQVLSGVQEEAWFKGLITAAVRVRNILAKAGDEPVGEVDRDLLVEAREKDLMATMQDLRPLAREASGKNDWKEAVQILSRLEPVIAAFFDEVLVNAEDRAVRRNRLALLASCQEMFRLVGDLGMLK